MINQLIITRDELCDLVASVLQYNRKVATEFRFVGMDGEVMMRDFVCEVACESEPIKVRVVPDDEQTLGLAMDSAARMIDQWRTQRKNRPTAETIKS
jgi:hypothetical protein